MNYRKRLPKAGGVGSGKVPENRKNSILELIQSWEIIINIAVSEFICPIIWKMAPFLLLVNSKSTLLVPPHEHTKE